MDIKKIIKDYKQFHALKFDNLHDSTNSLKDTNDKNSHKKLNRDLNRLIPTKEINS